MKHTETQPDSSDIGGMRIILIIILTPIFFVAFSIVLSGIMILPYLLMLKLNLIHQTTHVPDITLAFMNFRVFNSTETRFNAKWNLSIRVPQNLPGSYVCLQGDFQASLLYKNITIATSPAKSYSNLRPHWAQLLKVSGIVSEEDTNGAIGKNIMGDIKERSEVRFGLRLFFPDCRNMTTGTMSYTCDDAKFQIDSNSQMTATAFGNPTCHYDDH